MQLVTDALMRSLLQLPQRPYLDVRAYDGTPYYDLTRREVVQLLSVSGMASGVPHQFALGSDFRLTADSIDWSIPSGMKPDFGSPFWSEYTYSRLGSAAASTAMFFAGLKVTHDLGSKYPYGSTTADNLAYTDLAMMGQAILAAAIACQALSTSDVDSAVKYRRGTVLVDDTKKSDDWMLEAKSLEEKYDAWRVIMRGPVRSFGLAIQLISGKVFDDMQSAIGMSPSDQLWVRGFM